jgi:peptidoglycan hydrolase-like protein with peptidoglycan-binding domain
MGYLQGVTMVWTRSLRWTCALVVTAAAAFILATPSSAYAQAQSQSLQAKPLPSAGWHGAPIKRPLPARNPVAATTRASDRGMSLGAGFGRPAGSPEVRALQRSLRSLGYACGPADGLFGTRTQASLQWFQIKHGLRPTGSANGETLRILHLRDRAPAPREAGPRADVPASSQAPTRAANAQRPHPAATPSHSAPATAPRPHPAATPSHSAPATAPRPHPAATPSHSAPATAPRPHPAATPSHSAPATAPRPHPAATPSHSAPPPQRGGQGLGAVPIALLLAAAVALLSLVLTVAWRRSWRTRVSDAGARFARRLRSAPALLRRAKAAPVRPRTGPGQS